MWYRRSKKVSKTKVILRMRGSSSVDAVALQKVRI